MEEPVSEGGGTSGNGRRRDKSQRTEDGVGGRKEEGEAHRGKHVRAPQKRAQSPPSAPRPTGLRRRIGPCAPVGPKPSSQYIGSDGTRRRVKIVATHQRWPVRGDGLDWDAEWEFCKESVSKGMRRCITWRLRRRTCGGCSGDRSRPFRGPPPPCAHQRPLAAT